ncbi:MAG: LysR family transcriptional regulator [Olsenella sp.]|nr:LysR family transcriptional regulator [Olsenella sp.]
MNTQQISCFLEAALSNSFSKAAKRLYISQPSFSRYISQLEKELGVTLFSRNSFNGVNLTKSGKVMYEAFLEAHGIIEEAADKARRLEHTDALRLTMGLLEGQLIDSTLEDKLSRFRLEYPNVTVSVRRDTYRQLMKSLEDSEVDLVCMPEWEFRDRGDLTIAPHAQIESVLAAPKRLVPKAEDRTYSLAEFSDLTFVSVAERGDRPIAGMLEGLFSEAGIDPHVILAESLSEQIQLVEMGEGAILINPFNYICFSPNISCFRVRELAPQPFAFAWRKVNEPRVISLLRPFLLDDDSR